MFHLRVLIMGACFAVGVSTGHAALYNLSGTIDGAQANAGIGTGSGGTGSILGSYDDVTLILSWNISWSGLTGTVVNAHFHGPALPNQNAGVQVAIPFAVNPAVGNAPISGAQGTDLISGLWYVNIHTDNSPGGEIRGLVTATQVPEPSSIFLLGLAGLVGLLVRQRYPAGRLPWLP